MREVTNDYLAQVQASGRQFGACVKIYNAAEPDVLWLGDIISIDILRSCSDQLQIGACMSDKLTLQTKATALFGGKGKKIEVYYRCTAPVLDWIKLGTFYVEESVTKQGVTAVTAYDMMARLDKRVRWIDSGSVTAPVFPCKMQAVLNYLCARTGVTTDFTCEDITISKAPDGYTARELISYIAASHGRNARFSPSEVLKFPAYEEVEKTVQYGRCYSLDIAGGSGYTVKGILFQRGGDDKIYIDGTASEYDETADGVVEVYDPFATVAISEYAWNKLGGLNYSAVSLEMPAENILEPGDVFTVEDADGTQKKAVVMEQELSLSCTGGFVEKISCTAESKAQNRNTENRQEAAEKQAAASTTVLTSYKYLTDLSAQCNGITYTVEKDAETGLISKISDSNGHVLTPEIPEGITDVAMHNAAVFALAMARGLGGSSTIMPVIEGLVGYFDYKRDCTTAQWINQLGGNNIPITAGAIVDTDCLQMPDGTYGTFPFSYTDGVLSVYAVLKCSEPISGAGTWGINYLLGTGPMAELGNARFLGAVNGAWSAHSSGGTYDIISDVPSTDDYHVLCLTCGSNDQSSQSQTLYIDGQAVGNVFPQISPYGGVWGLNCICNDATVQERSHLTSYWRMMALGRTEHTAEQVARNTAWLKNYYDIGGNT